jgi:hypothetical protein
MPIVTAREVAAGLKLDKLGFISTFIGWLILKITRISKINRQYDSLSHFEGLEYINKTLDL